METQTQKATQSNAGSSENPTLFTEYAETGEEKNYALLNKHISATMQKLYGDKKRALRDTHAKSQAAVKAHLEIFDIDEVAIKKKLAATGLTKSQIERITVKQGLFAEPGKYRVWLRYANGNGGKHPDSAPDTRSMSVKIMEVKGARLKESFDSHNMDIVTQNCNVFFISTIRYYFSFLKAIDKSKFRLILWLICHLRQAWALKKITSFAPKSLLTERYWSGSAYSLGVSDQGDEICPEVESVTYPAVVKYGFTPVSAEAPHSEIARQPIGMKKKDIPANYYRDQLISELAKPDARYCWDLGIQFQTTPEMSIDNLLVAWSEQESPFLTIGRLTVEHQIIDFDEQYNFCENLKFAPWHSLEVHRPVGALNRLRGFVYPLVAAYRHKKIGDDYKEPRNFDMVD